MHTVVIDVSGKRGSERVASAKRRPTLDQATEPAGSVRRIKEVIDALDNFYDCDRSLDAGSGFSLWRKCSPPIARGCSNCAGDEVHVSPPSFQLRQDNATPGRPESSTSPQAEQFAGASKINFIFKTESKEQYQ
jgi:hypothetical protein